MAQSLYDYYMGLLAKKKAVPLDTTINPATGKAMGGGTIQPSGAQDFGGTWQGPGKWQATGGSIVSSRIGSLTPRFGGLASKGRVGGKTVWNPQTERYEKTGGFGGMTTEGAQSMTAAIGGPGGHVQRTIPSVSMAQPGQRVYDPTTGKWTRVGQAATAVNGMSAIDYLSSLLRSQSADENEAKAKAEAAITKIETAIGAIGGGLEGESIEAMGKLAQEIAANPGLSDEDVKRMYTSIVEEQINPEYAALQARTAEAGGPGVRQQLGKLGLASVQEKIRAMRGLKTEEATSRQAGRSQALSALSATAGAAGSASRDKVQALLTLESMKNYDVEDTVGLLIEAIASENPALALAAIARARGSTAGGGAMRLGALSGTAYKLGSQLKQRGTGSRLKRA